MKDQAPIDPAVVEQASEWLMLHWNGELDAAQREAFAAWQQADSEHRRAWQRLQQLQRTLGSVPEHSSHVLLAQPVDHQRRAALKVLACYWWPVAAVTWCKAASPGVWPSLDNVPPLARSAT